jgi:hypothetical protein
MRTRDGDASLARHMSEKMADIRSDDFSFGGEEMLNVDRCHHGFPDSIQCLCFLSFLNAMHICTICDLSLLPLGSYFRSSSIFMFLYGPLNKV